MNKLEHRFGKIFISRDLIEDSPDKVIELLSGGLVLRCEFRFISGEFEYELYHPSFPLIDEGRMPTAYWVEVFLKKFEKLDEFQHKYSEIGVDKLAFTQTMGGVSHIANDA